MPNFYASLGIIHQRICVETPQQNSVVDRKHRHLINVTRSLLFHAHLNKCFWSYDVCHATYLINRIYSPIIDNKTPYDLLFQQPPSFNHIKTFGCLVYAITLTRNKDKLDPRAHKCLFLGYPNGINRFLLFNLHTRYTFTSRNNIFYGNIFTYTIPRYNIPTTILLKLKIQTISSLNSYPTLITTLPQPQPIQLQIPHPFPALNQPQYLHPHP